MDSPGAVLHLYDAQMRQDPIVDLGARVERVGPVVRVLGKDNYVIFSDLDDSNVQSVVAEQAEFFRRAGLPVEWKLFGHDRPKRLEQCLCDAGFVPEEPETLVVFDLRDGTPGGDPSAEVEVRHVADPAGVNDAARAANAAFGPDGEDHSARYAEMARDPNQGLFVAYLEGAPVASGRLDLPPGRSFAGMFGGGTAPPYRHQGVYRALVRARAEYAAARGFRFLTVDARESSRPILERLGFVTLTTTTPWVLRPSDPAARETT